MGLIFVICDYHSKQVACSQRVRREYSFNLISSEESINFIFFSYLNFFKVNMKNTD